MPARRRFLQAIAFITTVAALNLPILADELIGRLTKFDKSTKTLTVEGRGGKTTEVKITDATTWATPKGERKIPPEKLERLVEKAKKGVPVEITHEGGVASKIERKTRKKSAER